MVVAIFFFFRLYQSLWDEERDVQIKLYEWYVENIYTLLSV